MRRPVRRPGPLLRRPDQRVRPPELRHRLRDRLRDRGAAGLDSSTAGGVQACCAAACHAADRPGPTPPENCSFTFGNISISNCQHCGSINSAGHRQPSLCTDTSPAADCCGADT